MRRHSELTSLKADILEAFHMLKLNRFLTSGAQKRTLSRPMVSPIREGNRANRLSMDRFPLLFHSQSSCPLELEDGRIGLDLEPS